MSDRDELLAQGFADCEALIVAMLSNMATAEAEKSSRASVEVERLREAGCSEETIAIHGRLAHKHYARSATLREALLAVSVGQHRTDAYDEEAVAKAHQEAAKRHWRRKGGNARAERLTPEQRQEAARTAANARWGKGEPK